MSGPKIMSTELPAMYRHSATWDARTVGDLSFTLNVEYQGPIEAVRTQTVRKYESVDDAPAKLRGLRLELIGVINTEGDEEILGYDERFLP